MTTAAPKPQYLPPLGGQVLGCLVSALRLHRWDADRLLSCSQAKAYFRGVRPESPERVDEAYQQRVERAIADALLKSGLVPRWPAVTGAPPRDQAEALAVALGNLARFSDFVRGQISGKVTQFTDPIISWRPVLRLSAVALGFHVGALFTLVGWNIPASIRPFWATKDGRGWLLRHWTSEGGFVRTSPAELLRLVAQRDGASEDLEASTVSRWLSGEIRPELRHVQAISEVLAARSEGNAAELFRQLEWFGGLHEIVREVVAAMSVDGDEDLVWEIVEDAAALALRILRRTMEFLASVYSDAEKTRALAIVWMDRGSQDQSGHIMLQAFGPTLLARETDRRSRDFVRHAFQDWGEWLFYIARNTGDVEATTKQWAGMNGIDLPEARAFIRRVSEISPLMNMQDDLSPIPPGSHVTRIVGDLETKIGNRLAQADAAATKGDVLTAIAHARRAVELGPNHYMAQYKLGCYLERIGRSDEAILHLRKSIEARSDWDRNRGEIGVILLNAGKHAEAESEMRMHVVALGRHEPWLLMLLATALAKQQKWEEACSVFAESLKLRPDDVHTLHFAAEAHFLSGDLKNGLRCAKKAADLGQPEMYTRWKVGDFGGRRRK